MPSSLPDAATLLRAAIKYLEDELLPTLDGYHRFKVRVTANVLATLQREQELGDQQAETEQARLIGLLGHAGDVTTLSRELAEEIRRGHLSSEDAALGEHIRTTLNEALAINNPRWLRE